MKIVIDLGNLTGISRFWLDRMINKEILETTGALQNDILWSKGAESEEVVKLHLENQRHFKDYLDVLKDIQKQMHNEPKDIFDIDNTSEHEHLMISEELPKLKELPGGIRKKAAEEAKADAGKPQLSLAPINEMWKVVARVREFGVQKYEKNNWKTVEVERYYDALYRHIGACLDDPHAIDSESGLPHMWHVACNLAFIMELDKELQDANRTNNKKN